MVVSCGGEKKQTDTVKQTLNPVFNAQFTFPVYEGRLTYTHPPHHHTTPSIPSITVTYQSQSHTNHHIPVISMLLPYPRTPPNYHHPNTPTTHLPFILLPPSFPGSLATQTVKLQVMDNDFGITHDDSLGTLSLPLPPSLLPSLPPSLPLYQQTATGHTLRRTALFAGSQPGGDSGTNAVSSTRRCPLYPRRGNSSQQPGGGWPRWAIHSRQPHPRIHPPLFFHGVHPSTPWLRPIVEITGGG